MEAVGQSDFVLTMLPNSQIVNSVLVQGGVLDALKDGAMAIDSSTIDPSMAIEIAQYAQQNGKAFVDAPVSGGVTGADNGTLTFMVGADNAEVFQVSFGFSLFSKLKGF